jgi:hypothetical protein
MAIFPLRFGIIWPMGRAKKRACLLYYTEDRKKRSFLSSLMVSQKGDIAVIASNLSATFSLARRAEVKQSP